MRERAGGGSGGRGCGGGGHCRRALHASPTPARPFRDRRCFHRRSAWSLSYSPPSALFNKYYEVAFMAAKGCKKGGNEVGGGAAAGAAARGGGQPELGVA